MKDTDLDNLPERVRWKLAVLIVGAVAVIIGGFGMILWLIDGPAQPTPEEPTPTPMASLTPEPDFTRELAEHEEKFLLVMRERPAFSTESDAKLLDTGYAVCVGLNTGVSVGKMDEVVQNSGVTAYDSGWLIGGSVHTLCPENVSKLPEEGQ